MSAAPMPRFEHPCPECGHHIVNINDRPEPHDCWWVTDQRKASPWKS
jgi:hypothetical protein